METDIATFHKEHYEPLIYRLGFHLPHVQMLGTNHCAKLSRKAFESRVSEFFDLFCGRDYADQFVLKADVEVQSQHFGGNTQLSMEGVSVEHKNNEPEVPDGRMPYKQFVAEFFSHLSDESRQDAATTNAHMMQLIEILLDHEVFKRFISWLWETTDGCAKQYRCVTTLYLLSTLSQKNNIVIDQSI